MSNKSYQNNLFKRIIDLGRVTTADVDDLVRIWRVGSGDEKAITLANFVATVDEDLGSGGLNLTELVEALEQNKVPYTGATGDVDLGNNSITLDSVIFNDVPSAVIPQQLAWNPDKYTLDLGMGLGDSVQQIGMETYYTPVKNQTGSLIPDGTFVMATGSLGASGRITVAPAVTDGSVDSRYMLGVTTHDIADGGDGLVTWFGEIRGFNTNTKAPVGETWIDGTVLWNNPAVAGGFTSVEPQAPNLKIPVAIVISAGNNGVIFVRPRLGMRLTDLHDVNAFTPSSNDLIAYNGTKWEAVSRESIVLNTPLTGYSVGSNTALASTDTILGAFGKVQGQINAKIGGTIASGQVAFGTGTNTVGGSNNLFWDSANGRLGIGTNSPTQPLEVRGLVSIDRRSNNFVTGLNINSGSTPLSVFQIKTDNANSLSIIGARNGFALALDTGDVERVRITSSGNVGILTTSPTNTLDVNGTARIRSLTGTTGYLPLLSSTGVMGQSVAYNAGTGIVINGTFLPSGAVFSVNGVLFCNNWATAGAYDKLSIDFGENRGFGYDPTPNEIFVKGATTVPVKIDTDAPTDSLNVLSTGGVEMKNLQAGTISDNIGLNSSGELVKGVAGLVQSVSGTAVNNTDPLNPIISVDNWTFETLIDTITLNDTNGNVTYTCNSTITIFTNSKLNIKTLYLNITNIASSGTPSGGAFEIKGYNFYNFIGANDISVLYEVKEFRGTSYTESLLPLLRPDALGTFDGQLIFRKINNTQQQPPFTSTNGEITIKIAKFKQS